MRLQAMACSDLMDHCICHLDTSRQGNGLFAWSCDEIHSPVTPVWPVSPVWPVAPLTPASNGAFRLQHPALNLGIDSKTREKTLLDAIIAVPSHL